MYGRTLREVRIDECAPDPRDELADPAAGRAFIIVEHRIFANQCLNHPALDEPEKQLLEMYYQGHKQVEIAETVGITQPAISQRLKKIRAKLHR